MSNIPISMKELIELSVAQQVQSQMTLIDAQVHHLQEQTNHSIQQLELVADRIQDQRAMATVALDTLSSAMKVQQTASPDLLRPIMQHQMMGNRAHHLASCYYESMIRYWNASNVVYILSTQINVVSHAVALEINRAGFELTIAAQEAKTAWHAFDDSLTSDIELDMDMIEDVWDERAMCVTLVFIDGLTINYTVSPYAMVQLGGLPVGTFVYINGAPFEIADGGVYKLGIDIHGFQRITSLINYGRIP